MKGARSDKVNHFLQQVTRAGIGKGARSDRTVSITDGRKRLRKAITGAANATKRAKAGRGRQR